MTCEQFVFAADGWPKGKKNVRGLACKSIDFDQGECRPLQVLTCNNDHIWPILEEKIKKFHDGTDLTARIDRDYQSGATLLFAKNLRWS